MTMVQDNMTNKEHAELLMQYIGNNYKFLKSEFKKIFTVEFNEDGFSDCILRCYNCVERKGFKYVGGIHLSGKSFINYMVMTYRTTIAENGVMQQRKYKRDDVYLNVISDRYFSLEKTIQEYNKQMGEEIFIQEIFTYVDKTYNDEDASLFQFYFMTDFTYKELAKITFTSVGKVHKSINMIKRDIKEKFSIEHKQIKSREDY